MSISPSLSPRQCPDRYAFRAGRNLPDKEFRYLRTVIVTAAVYRGFASELRGEPLTPPLDLPAPGRRQCLYVVSTTSQAPVFLVNSRLGRDSAAETSSTRTGFTRPGSPSSEGTGTICRVPWPRFTRAPEAPRLAHLCRFAVRSVTPASFAKLFSAAFSRALGRPSRDPLGIGSRPRSTDLPMPVGGLPPCISAPSADDPPTTASLLELMRPGPGTGMLTRFPSATL